MEMVVSCVFFVFESWQIQDLQPKPVPYNKLLTNLARFELYWGILALVCFCMDLTAPQWCGLCALLVTG